MMMMMMMIIIVISISESLSIAGVRDVKTGSEIHGYSK